MRSARVSRWVLCFGFSMMAGCAEPAPPEPIARVEAAVAGMAPTAVPGAECTDPGPAFCDPSVTGHSDCACSVPTTGAVSPLFRELDIVMRQFMKWRCVGAGTLAVSYKGRRVYKRGFGRYSGPAQNEPAACNADLSPGQDDLIATSPLVAPDEPMPIGSVSKGVTAAMARWLIQKLLDTTGYPATVTSLKLHDILGSYQCNGLCTLLPDDIRRMIAHWDPVPVVVNDYDDLDGTEWEFKDTADPPTPNDYECNRAAGDQYADVAWQDVTVGDLIAHTAGLTKSPPDWASVVVPNIGVFRGYTSEEDWEQEHQSMYAAFFEYSSALHDTQLETYGSTVPAMPLYVRQHLPGEDPADEVIRATVGRCLVYEPLGSTDGAQGDPGFEGGTYSNTGYLLLHRIVAHLHASQRYAAPTGKPELHDGSALDDFLAQELGLFEGVESKQAILHRQRALGIPNPGPIPRDWSSGDDTYYWTAPDEKRPFCLWSNFSQACRFGTWQSHDELKSPFNFALNEDGDPLQVPFWQRGDALHIGTGALLAEAPALLRLVDKYVFHAGIQNGRERANCGGECGYRFAHGGSIDGGRAFAFSSDPLNKPTDPPTYTTKVTIPRRDAFGRLTESLSTRSVAIAETRGVNFVVSVSQRTDKGCGDECADAYDRLLDFVRYGLSRVDWEEVDRMVAAQRRHVVGAAQNGDDKSAYWYESDGVHVRTGDPLDHYDLSLVSAPLPTTVRSPRIGTDVAGVAAGSSPLGSNAVYTYFRDGKYVVGEPDQLDMLQMGEFYQLPSGKSPHDIIDVAMRDSTEVFAYFRDGTYASGDEDELDVETGSFSVPTTQTVEQMVGVSLATAAGSHTFAHYRDGSVSEGSTSSLGAFGWHPGPVAGMGMDDEGNLLVWYRSGLVRQMSGTPEANQPISATSAVTAEFDFVLPPERETWRIVDVALGNFPTSGWVLYTDGTLDEISSDDFRSETSYTPTVPFGYTIKDLRGMAYYDGQFYTWWTKGLSGNGQVAVGNTSAFAAGSLSASQLDVTCTIALIDAMAMDGAEATPRVWTLFKDGSIAHGTIDDLDAFACHPATP